MSKFYNLSALSAEGENLSFSSLEGYVLLIVNTASKCGFSKQYSGLQKLYEKYEGNKFKILAFPCNQFGSQEPGNQDEILKFCVKNHGVTFPIMDKIFVYNIFYTQMLMGRFYYSACVIKKDMLCRCIVLQSVVQFQLIFGVLLWEG